MITAVMTSSLKQQSLLLCGSGVATISGAKLVHLIFFSDSSDAQCRHDKLFNVEELFPKDERSIDSDVFNYSKHCNRRHGSFISLGKGSLFKTSIFETPKRYVTTPTILSTSPSSHSSVNDTVESVNIDSRVQNRSDLVKFQWENPKSQDPSKKWLQRMERAFFVITRGIEIAVRLTPLFILTPTALLVSSLQSLYNKKMSVKNSPYLPSSARLHMEKDRIDDNDFYTMQFQNYTCNRLHKQYDGQTWASNLAWRYTLHTLQSLGPTFCKLGQWAATRRDLFPVNVCNRFSELHDMARTHDLSFTHEMLVEAFGDDYTSRGLILMKDVILGSGSAAQVYKGTLSANLKEGSEHMHARKRTVAIKVLHPNIRALVEQDLELIQSVADFIDSYIPLEVVKMLNLPRAVRNFADIMRKQVDLRIEGDNLKIFRNNFGCSERNQSHKIIDFPQPKEGWVSEHVLVEDYAGDDAVSITSFLIDESPEGLEIRRRIAAPLLSAFLKMVFVDNFIHSDLHPGNLLVRAVPSRSDPNKFDYTLIFLDVGIATSLNPRDQQNLYDLFKSVVLNDGYTAGLLMVERARYERCSSIPGGKHAFASGISDIVSEFHDRSKKGLTLGAVKIGTLLGRVLDLCRIHGVEIDPAMTGVIFSMLVLEGLGRSLDPNLNIMQAAMPFLLGKV